MVLKENRCVLVKNTGKPAAVVKIMLKAVLNNNNKKNITSYNTALLAVDDVTNVSLIECETKTASSEVAK